MSRIKKKNGVIRANPRIMTTTPREPMSLFIPKGLVNFLVLFAAVGSIYYIFFLSDYFKVKKILFEGNINETGRFTVEQLKGKNIFTINNFKLSEDVQKTYPQAYSVNIYKGLPETLKVVTSERSMVMVWQSNNRNYLVDKMGVVFGEAGDISKEEKLKSLPLVQDVRNFEVHIGARLISSRFIDFISYINDNFTKVEGVKPTRIEVEETSFHPILVTEFGWKVYLDSNRSPADQLDDLKFIIDKHKLEIHEYVDLRVKGYGYWK